MTGGSTPALHDGGMGVMNFGRLLTQAAARWPDRPALVWRDRTWNWRELDRRVDSLVSALRAGGLGKGERVMVMARNCNQLIESSFAAFKAGGVWVPVNYRLTPPEVAGLAETTRPRVILYDPPFADHVDAACVLLSSAGSESPRVVSLGEPRAGEEGYEALVEAHRDAEPFHAEVVYGDPMWFFFTSGTTGRPKAAVLTHGQMAFVLVNHIADLMPGLGHESASLAVAPLSHGAGMHLFVNIARAAKTVLLPGEKLDPEAAWRLVEEHRIDNMFTVPTIVKILTEHPAVDRYDHSSLRWVIYAGAPMYREDQKRALSKLGPVLVQYFGLGEVTGAITVLPSHMHSLDDAEMRIGTCGYPRTGMEVAIKDPEGRILPPGEQGEICARGPAVFAGYFENPEANAKALKDGWFHTGDLGRLDESGFLYITGRASDMYISGGANIYPREAEEVLLTHPAVSEVAILGVPDLKWGEIGVAVVVADPSGQITGEELIGYLDGRLAKYKWPRKVVFWNDLPKSGYGKVPKHLIRKQLYERGDLKSRPAAE